MLYTQVPTGSSMTRSPTQEQPPPWPDCLDGCLVLVRLVRILVRERLYCERKARILAGRGCRYYALVARLDAGRLRAGVCDVGCCQGPRPGHIPTATHRVGLLKTVRRRSLNALDSSVIRGPAVLWPFDLESCQSGSRTTSHSSGFATQSTPLPTTTALAVPFMIFHL